MRRFLMMMTVIGLCSQAGCSSDTSSVDGGNDDGNNNTDGLRTCGTKDDCLAGEKCIGGFCVLGTPCQCNSDCDKTAQEVCNSVKGKCESGLPPLNCVDDCSCFKSETCDKQKGKCVRQGGDTCEKPEDCDIGKDCVEHKCVPVNCATREDCAGVVCLVCKSNKCIAPPDTCVKLDDCCMGFHCNFGTCMPDDSGCESDSDCNKDPAFPHCVDGECVPECIGDIDCPNPGQKCIQNKCVIPGCTPQQCKPPVGWCDLAAGECKPGCDSNDDCLNYGETCDYNSHQCGNPDCCGNACTGNTYCDSLTCQCADKCSATKPCPTDFNCDLGTGVCMCTANACPTGTTCNSTTGACDPNSTCTGLDPNECPAGTTCVNGSCQATGTGKEGEACFSDSQCDAGVGLLCNSSVLCLLCSMMDPNFNPDFTCRYECSLQDPDPVQACASFGIPDLECKYWHLGLKGLCVPPTPPPAP